MLPKFNKGSYIMNKRNKDIKLEASEVSRGEDAEIELVTEKNDIPIAIQGTISVTKEDVKVGPFKFVPKGASNSVPGPKKLTDIPKRKN